MAHIAYVPEDEQPPALRVADRDHIIQIHAVHPEVMGAHLELYLELMRRPSPLTRIQRELVAVAVSADNGCGY